jgi:hypothetical protein
MTAPAESVMKAIVERQCGPGAGERRRFERLTVGADRGRGKCVSVKGAYANVLSELCRVGNATGTGFGLAFDVGTRMLVFDSIVGTDRSAAQALNGRALFAEDYDSLKGVSLTEGHSRYSNTLFVRGAKLEPGRITQAVWENEEPSGVLRFERELDAWSCGDAESLARYGEARLSSYGPTFRLEGEVPADSPIVLDRDYFLGDLCTVKAFGRWYTVPLESIEERWTKDGPGRRATFGSPVVGARGAALKETSELWEALRSA